MKHCPQCRSPYEDSENYCLKDGNPLISDDLPRFNPQADTLTLPEVQLVSESALDYAARLNSQMEFKASFEAEVTKLYDEIRKLVESISKRYDRLLITFGRHRLGALSFSDEYYLDCGDINVQLSSGCYKQGVDGKQIFNPWLRIRVHRAKYYPEGPDKIYHPCVIEPDTISWQETGENPKLLTSTQLADECLKCLILEVAKEDSSK